MTLMLVLSGIGSGWRVFQSALSPIQAKDDFGIKEVCKQNVAVSTSKPVVKGGAMIIGTASARKPECLVLVWFSDARTSWT
jgi:hypothetical protein